MNEYVSPDSQSDSSNRTQIPIPCCINVRFHCCFKWLIIEYDNTRGAHEYSTGNDSRC